MTKFDRAKRNDDTTPETRRRTRATVRTRGCGASAANRRQTGHGRAKDDGR
jgi:hypothetical protein